VAMFCRRGREGGEGRTTNMSAPASAISRMFFTPTPPSTYITQHGTEGSVSVAKRRDNMWKSRQQPMPQQGPSLGHNSLAIKSK
jgi:hypothetical protein